jgi:4-hydroxybenzoate polyprenyltransferase
MGVENTVTIHATDSRFRQLRNRLLGAFHLTQPFETVLMQALPAALFMRLASPRTDFRGLLTLFFAVIAIYGAVGALNDYCDFDLDSANVLCLSVTRARTRR